MMVAFLPSHLGAFLACAGAAGAAYAQEFHAVGYGIGMKVGLIAYAAAIIGGVGRTAGTVAGGLLIGVLEALVVGYLSPTYRDPIVFGVLILILLFRPAGLLGRLQPEKV